ncbi:MAG: hypothetical protein LBT97_01770, partial [Planctomycetota bacterium]|nr:hypothetical protein [Planctomycetota bacterium]
MSASATDDAVLAADLRRRAEDLFGGTGRAAWNLVKDFAFGMERYIGQKGLSPVSAAVGSAVGAIAAYSLNPALGMATLFGASKMEIYDEVLAETGDRDAAHLVSDIFREQVTDATGDHKLAADAADMVFAMSRVSGARMGLTPEQYLNLRPIQVTLQNALERARSANDIVADMDAREFAREATAAQKAFTLYQDAAKPRVFVESPAGGLDFGAISQEMASTPEARAEGIVAAPIRLEEGFQEENRDEGHKGYGRAHINAQISEVMAEMGYSDASEFVQAIVADPTAFYQADRNRYMVAKENGKNSIAIIELVKEESGGSDVYTVITAGVRKRIPKRYKMLWSGSASPATTPGASSVLASESGVSPGPAAEGALDAKASIPTIPAKGTDVNAWNQAVLYRQGRNMPGEVVWDGSAGQQQDSGDPARISYRDPQNAGTDAALRNSGQTASSINSIPAEGADVNAWNRDALDNLLRQSGVSEEQADIFRQYVESLLQSGEDVIDAQALGRDLTAALASAEGLEQAAAGLERILADPASITDAVFRAAGVEAPTGQQGIAELQRRMADLRKRADEFRTFYKSPETLSRVRQATAGDRGQRGDASLTPDVSVIRLFNGRQDRSTIFHELFHVYFHGLEQAAKAEGAPEQVRADYETLNAAVEGGLTATDPDARTAAEERAATMFERYLSEGRAPTPFLADAFARLRTW